jgi:outer membrane autotransporter protein
LFGYQDTNVDSDGGNHLCVTGGQVGVYALGRSGRWFGQALVEGGKDSYNDTRVSFGGTASGKTDGTMASGQLGIGYRLGKGPWTYGPEAGVQYTRVGMKGFKETGSLVPETFGDQSADSLGAKLGAKVAGNFRVSKNLTLEPMARGAWVKEFSYKGGDVDASFAGSAFAVEGSEVGQSGFEAEAVLGLSWKDRVTLSGHYQKDLGRKDYVAQTVGGTLQVRF